MQQGANNAKDPAKKEAVKENPNNKLFSILLYISCNFEFYSRVFRIVGFNKNLSVNFAGYWHNIGSIRYLYCSLFALYKLKGFIALCVHAKLFTCLAVDNNLTDRAATA